MAFSSWIRNWKRSIERRWAIYQTVRRKSAARRLAKRPGLEALEDRWLLSTYFVTNTNNSGAGSLFDAITQANAGKFNEIDFNIGAKGTPSGMHTISPSNSSYLPNLTANGVFINGHSENVWQGVSTTSPLIELNGSGVTFFGVDGLDLKGSGTLVQGLFITGWYGSIEVNGSHNTIGGTTAGQGNVLSGNTNTYGVVATGSQNLFEGNYVGTDVTGSSALGSFYGFNMAGSDNTIGGTVSGAGNVISGNFIGVYINTSGVIMEGNYIGLNAAGTGAIGNGTGISVTTSGNVINGGNVISGNTDGIDIHSGGVTVVGNFIGTNAAGTGAVGNSIGINVMASAVVVGGTGSGQANVISGNSTDGIQINSSNVNVENNFIGTDNTGVNLLGNGNDGVNINGNNNTVGTGNIIAGNGNNGVEVGSGSGNIITQNSIFSNTALGILVDSGANNNVAAPTISSASITGYTLTVNGSFTAATANVPYVLEFFGNVDGDPEGKAYIGSLTVTPTSTGTQNFTYTATTTVPRTYPLVTATLTDNSGNTSQLSNGDDATTIYVVTSTADSGTGTLRDAITQANNTASGITTIDFGFLIPPPVQGALSGSTTGGSITAGTYYYVLTTLTAAGETTISNEQSITTTGSTSSVILHWAAVPGATGYKIYRSNTSGVYTDPALITTIASGSTITYTDTAAATSAGAPPSSNTAGPATGAQTISPVTALPTLTANNVFINGLSQGGFGNTTPLVTLNGSGAGSSDGLLFKGTSDVVSGLIIQHFSKNGVEVGGANDTVGGAATGLGNVLSGNTIDGVLIDSGVSGVAVQGNYIGTNLAGTGALANSVGVEVAGSNATINALNIISGNTTDGVLIDSSASGVSVQGNYIGTDVTGAKSVANGTFGIDVEGSSNAVGGSVAGAGNVISGNTSDGVHIGSVSGVAVLGNFIGTDSTGLNSLGNSGSGVNITGNKNTVGAGNVISANGKGGVLISTGSGDKVTQNSIFANTGNIGISLVAGANNSIVAPTISSASVSAYTLTVKGTFTAATANVPYVLEFFGSPNGDAEGKGYIGSVTVTPTSTGTQNFSFTFTTTVPRVYPTVTATVTDNSGNTSQFSNGVSTGKVYVVTSTADSGTGSLRDAITSANNTSSGITAIDFSIGTSGSAQTISPASALPALTANNVFINGLSQGGLSNTTQLITLNGSGAGSVTDGVLLQGTTGVVEGLIIENFSKNGIEVAGANNIIGGSGTGQGNVLSGNTTDGLLIDPGVSGVQVQGNFIGTDVTGSKSIANSIGLEVGGSNNTIGGTASGAHNLISGNTASGLLIDNGANGNQVLGNFIGTNATGTSPSPSINFPTGFAGSGGFFTYNGGSSLNGNNLEVTSGTNSEARSIFTTGQVGITNFVTQWTQNISAGSGNADGMTFTIQSDGNNVVGGGGGSLGFQGLANSVAIKFDLYNNSGEGINSTGLYTDGAAPTVPAIDLTPSGINLHSGDSMVITLTYDGATLTEKVFDPTANKTFTHSYSINIASTVGSSTAFVGFTGGTGGANFTGLIQNWSYTTPQPIGNSVGITVGGNNNTLGGTATGAGNVIAGNGTTGVVVSSGSGNKITQNSIFSNAGLGISLTSGANNNIVAPSIRTASYIGTTLTLKGSYTAATANVPYVLEFYGNPSGDPEGQVYIGSLTVTPTSTGTQSFTFTKTTTVPATDPLITATLTDNSGDTSQFSNGATATNQPPIYVVTSTADDGSAGTLRDAINQSNVVGSPITEIDFKIGTVGSAQTINLTSQLPTLTNTDVFINGLTQGGSGNTTRLITLNGSGAGSSSDGLLLQASGDVVSGLIIENFSKNGIEVSGSNNTIGGTTTGAGNVVSGNKGDGILINSGVSGILVSGDILGLDATGTTALGNSGNGLEVQGTNNTIGGPFLAERNYISGNSKDGILLGSSASGNLVQNGFIGLNTSGTVGVANLNGIEIAGASNTLGSTISGVFSYFSANSNDGILIDSTAKNTLVQNNFVGTDSTGQKALANSIGIEVAGAGTTIGGTVSGRRNFIAGNKGDGVKLDSTASGTAVLGNSIGLNLVGAALGNGGNGLNVLSSSNSIGGTASAARNIISGNTGDGVLLASGANGNQVLNNFIGVNLNGSVAVPNSGNGLEIASTGNTIGGTAGVAQNQISGNTGDGLLLDSTASGNLILGNFIGVNHAGTGALANKVGLEDAGASNTIGGSVTGATNIISGNTGDGVLLDSTASSDLFQGNFIGLNSSGKAALANGSNGIEIQGSQSTVGGSVLAARNYISANGNDGVLIGSSGSGNQVLGNFIGLDISGTLGVGNVNYGVSIAGTNNTLGGTTSAFTNMISGSSKDGVLLASTASGNLVQGNDVGTDYSGQKVVANSIGIEVAGTGNTLGGIVTAARNLVSGNKGDGVLLDSTASGNLVLGNLIGINTINKALANGGNGLDVLSNNNTIGGTALGSRNVLSGNSKDGLLIASGASGNQVIGNNVGTDYYYLAALGNGTNGIEVGGNGNAIGGTVVAAKNIISGNTGDGVKIDSGASGNQVMGNYIGTNANGLSAIGNGIGIEDGGSGNTLGGSVSGARNVISGNKGDGILLDSTASGEAVQNDLIGLIATTGNTGLANGKNGVEVQGDNNTIGGTVFAERNYIAGSGNDGVLIGSSGSGNVLLDNFIGVGVGGTHGVANLNGIEIAGTGNTIGSTVSGTTNLISASKSDGILIDSTGSGNLVLGNDVGPDYTGNNGGVANSGNGIEVAGTGNTLGGTTTAARNIISGNSNDGVLLDSTGSGNLVLGNNIGVNRSGTALANSGNGVEIAGNKNTVGGIASGAGNIISGNSKNGVLVSAGSGDTISRNSVFGNTVLGISPASGANNNIVVPTLSTSSLSGTTLTVTGSFTAPTANVAYVLEFFANLSGDAEGRIYLDSLTVTPSSTGTQNLTFTTTTTVTGTYPLITATLTDNTGDTSQFSNGVTVS